MLRIVGEKDIEDSHFVEMFENYVKEAKAGRMRGVALVILDQDDIATDYATSRGTGLCELVGTLEVLKNELLEGMRK